MQPTNVTFAEAEDYQPFVEQAGNQANFPNTTGTNPFALTGTVVRYLAIGGMPLSFLSTNITCEARSGTAYVKAYSTPFYPETYIKRALQHTSALLSDACNAFCGISAHHLQRVYCLFMRRQIEPVLPPDTFQQMV